MKRFFKFIGKCILLFIGLSVLWVVVHKWVPVPYTPLMAIRYFENDMQPTKHEWKSIEEISPYLALAVIGSEDQDFMKHNGFDRKAIEKAFKDNQSGRKIKGGSSISQQTAKNVFLFPARNWFRKGLETWFTLLIETIWSKERIMEVYLNSIEMGSGVFGAEAAAQYWFKKPALKLGQYEAAAIAAVLPNPRTYRASPASRFIEKRKAWIVRQMRNYGPFSLKE